MIDNAKMSYKVMKNWMKKVDENTKNWYLFLLKIKNN